MDDRLHPSDPKHAAWRRFLPVVLFSLIAHLIAMGSLPDLRPETASAAPALHATLMDAPIRSTTRRAPAKPAAQRAPPLRPAPEAVQAPVPLPPFSPTPPRADPATPTAPTPVIEPAATRPLPVAAPVSPPPPAPPTEPAALDPPVLEPPAPTPLAPVLPRASPPAPARLRYEVIATDTRTSPPTQTLGKGNVNWSSSGSLYQLDLVASVNLLFFSLDVLASHSEGSIDEHGLAPLRYTETPRRRPAVSTNFNRDPASPLVNTITFSAATNSYPLVSAAQDRLSVIFQLAALLRTNPAMAVEGRQITLFVAGVRGDAEHWNFQVVGRETVSAGGTSLNTLRLQRLARTGSNDRSLDIWFGLDALSGTGSGPYPAQIRYTETNGNRIDLILAGLEPAPK